MFVLNVLGGFILLIIAMLILYLFAIPIGAIIPVNLKYRPAKKGIDIYLTTNGMHTDFVLPTQNHLFDWAKIIDSEPFEKDTKAYPFLGLGWGDWGFYIDLDLWENLTAKLAAKTLLNPTTPTLMHITGYEELPHEKLRVEKVSISNEQYLKLCDFILSGFALKPNQSIDLLPGLSYTEHDNFYKGTGHYHALHTCNYWVNKGLRRIGVRTALWSPLDRGIFHQLDKIKTNPQLSKADY